MQHTLTVGCPVCNAEAGSPCSTGYPAGVVHARRTRKADIAYMASIGRVLLDGDGKVATA